MTSMIPTPDSRHLLDLVSTYKEAKAAMCAATAKDLHALFKLALEQNPTVKAAVWTQYTPYFNDGEPCVFSTNFRYGDPLRGKALNAAELEEAGFEWVAGGPPVAVEGEEVSEDFDIDRYMSEDHCYKNGESEESGIDPAHEAALSELFKSIPDELYEEILGDGVQVYLCATGIATSSYSHD